MSSIAALVPDHWGVLVKAHAHLSKLVDRIRGPYSAAVARFSVYHASVASGRPNPLRKPGVFTSILLVAALLLCHGVLGFTHEMSSEIDGPHPMRILALSGEHAAHGAVEHGTEDPGRGHLSASYFAVILFLVGAAMLGILLGTPRRQLRRSLPPRWFCFVPTFTHLPRGPTLTLLQVYRL